MTRAEIRFPSIYDYRTREIVALQLSDILRSISAGTAHQPFCELAHPDLTTRIPLQFHFNLRDTTYISLEQLGELISLLRFAHHITGVRSELSLPQSRRLMKSLLLPANFFEFVVKWAAIPRSLANDEPGNPHGGIIPFRSIKELVDVREAVSSFKKPRITRILHDSLGFDKPEHQLLVDSIVAELCDNIPNHSLSEGLIGGQIHSDTPRNLRDIETYSANIDIVVSDAGIGIFESLRRKHPKYYEQKGARDALADVFLGNVPATPGKNRGGIARMSQSVSQLSGRMLITIPYCSGNYFTGQVTCNPSHNFFPGTHVIVKVPKTNVRRGT